jgi:hypothetical protein
MILLALLVDLVFLVLRYPVLVSAVFRAGFFRMEKLNNGVSLIHRAGISSVYHDRYR